jgi:hypothetical protein
MLLQYYHCLIFVIHRGGLSIHVRAERFILVDEYEFGESPIERRVPDRVLVNLANAPPILLLYSKK